MAASCAAESPASSPSTTFSTFSFFVPRSAMSSQSRCCAASAFISSSSIRSSASPFSVSVKSTCRRVRSSCTRRLITLHSGMELHNSRCVRAMVSAHSEGSIFWICASSTHSSTDTSKVLSRSITPSLRQSSGFMEFVLKKG